jgi:hypothetical protein
LFLIIQEIYSFYIPIIINAVIFEGFISELRKENKRKATEDESQDEDEKKEKQKRQKSLSPYDRAFQMFEDKNSLVDVAIELDVKTDVVLNVHADYLRLVRMDRFVKIYNDLEKTFPYSSSLRMNKEGKIKKRGYNRIGRKSTGTKIP